MRLDPVSDALWLRLSGIVAETVGLYFPRPRWKDLQRGLVGAAKEFGFADTRMCVEWLCAAPLSREHLQTLASHLTTGETYFFRDKKTFQLLAERVLPELIRARRGRDQRLRLWSAGCCSGEEPYSLAILLHQLLPDLADWQVTIMGTDINGRFLQKAAAGVYGEWSFRDTPAGFKQRYFLPTNGGRFAIRPEIKRMVTFGPMNLVEDFSSAPAAAASAMDLIFCRNVLMYFTPEQTRKVIRNLHHALGDEGWLAVSPSELSQTLFSQFAPARFLDVVLYRKRRADVCDGETDIHDMAVESVSAVASERTTPSAWTAVETLDAPVGRANTAAIADDVPELPEYLGRAQTLANQGNLTEALAWCDQSITANKSDVASHHLRATIMLEQDNRPEARLSLQRTVYLQSDFILGHFALGNLARGDGHFEKAERHFAHVLRLLARRPPDEVLPESDGLTTRALTEIIRALRAPEALA